MVIPEAAQGGCPESIPTRPSVSRRPVVMDSGLTPAACPGMTARIMARGPSVRKAARSRKRVEPVLAKHMRVELARAEHRGERAVADVEPARVGAERRHHQRLAVAGEAAAGNRAAPLCDARPRMQMARDLAIRRI